MGSVLTAVMLRSASASKGYAYEAFTRDSSFIHLGQTILPLKSVIYFVASQKIQLGLYFLRITY